MNRTRLYTVTRGNPDNSPVLFLHGFLGSHREWLPLMERLADGYYCIAVDLPGHGQSAEIQDEAAYAFAGGAKAVLDALPLKCARKLRVVGYSMGGRLSLYLAIHHSNRVEQAIIESSSPGLLDAQTARARVHQDAQWAERFRSEPLEVVLRDWYQQSLFASLRKHSEIFSRMMAERIRNDGERVARSIEGMSVGRQTSLWDQLPQLTVDVCLLVGELDRKYQLVAEKMRHASKRIQVEIVEESGHNIHLEQPEAFTRCVRDQLDAF